MVPLLVLIFLTDRKMWKTSMKTIKEYNTMVQAGMNINHVQGSPKNLLGLKLSFPPIQSTYSRRRKHVQHVNP